MQTDTLVDILLDSVKTKAAEGPKFKMEGTAPPPHINVFGWRKYALIGSEKRVRKLRPPSLIYMLPPALFGCYNICLCICNIKDD